MLAYNKNLKVFQMLTLVERVVRNVLFSLLFALTINQAHASNTGNFYDDYGDGSSRGKSLPQIQVMPMCLPTQIPSLPPIVPPSNPAFLPPLLNSISTRSEEKVNSIAKTINSSIEINPFAIKLNVCLIHTPTAVNWLLPFANTLFNKADKAPYPSL